jgi:hypothetical protein
MHLQQPQPIYNAFTTAPTYLQCIYNNPNPFTMHLQQSEFHSQYHYNLILQPIYNPITTIQIHLQFNYNVVIKGRGIMHMAYRALPCLL